jgi:hypothetical protein
MKRVAILVGLFAIGCGTTSTPDPTSTSTSTSTPTSTSTKPVIAVLQTRDHRISLHAGSHVTVRTNEGALVANDVPIESLRETDPYVYDVVRSSFAGPAGGEKLDARIDKHDREIEKNPRGGPFLEGAMGN